ncbi:hypothetical protein BGZ83_003216 [Gryganskiella cystojenkinii]|nr:hypothetical protein BGZ83_003216 [Gryganskiella cystojenkinii]
MGSCLSTPGLSGGNTAYRNAGPIPPPPTLPTPHSYDLPKGWICQYDPNSKHLFYVNETTGQRQWEHPNGAASGATDATQFREQMAAYDQSLMNYNRMYGAGGAGYPQMSQQQQYNQQQPGYGYGGRSGGLMGGGRGGMGGMATGGMMGLLAGSLLGNSFAHRGGGYGGGYGSDTTPQYQDNGGSNSFFNQDGYGANDGFGGGGGGGGGSFFNQDSSFGGGDGGFGGGSSFFDQGGSSGFMDSGGGGGGGFFDQSGGGGFGGGGFDSSW